MAAKRQRGRADLRALMGAVDPSAALEEVRPDTQTETEPQPDTQGKTETGVTTKVERTSVNGRYRHSEGDSRMSAELERVQNQALPSTYIEPSDWDRTDQVVEMFLTTKARRSKETARVYRTEIERFLGWVQLPLAAVTYQDLLEFAEGLTHLAPASQARALATIRSLFKFALKLGVIGMNPAELLELPRVTVTSESRFLTREETRRLLTAAEAYNPAAALAVPMLALTGLRVSELVSIRWGGFFEDLSGNVGLRIVGKGTKARTVKIRPDLWNRIKAYREARGETIDFDEADESPLFANREGQPMSDRYMRQLVSTCAKQAGIKKAVSPHWLRHTSATLALDGGAPLLQVQRDLGHASITTTQRYLHTVKQLERTSTDFIEI